MLPLHISQRLKERNLNLSEAFILAVIKESKGKDTAALIKRISDPVFYYGDVPESNGDLVILIIRNNRPVTVFFRRSDQPFEEKALRVEQCISYL